MSYNMLYIVLDSVRAVLRYLQINLHPLFKKPSYGSSLTKELCSWSREHMYETFSHTEYLDFKHAY